MKKGVSILFNSKELVPLIIRLGIVFKFISDPIPFISSITILSSLGEVGDKAWSLGYYLALILPVLILWGFYALVFVKARKLTNWISKTNTVVSTKGDPDQWMIVAMQLFGISLVVSGIASVMNGIVVSLESTELALIQKYGVQSFVHAAIELTGAWVLITYPKRLTRWLKKRAN